MRLTTLLTLTMTLCLAGWAQTPQLSEAIEGAQQAIAQSDDALAEQWLERAVALAAAEDPKGPRLIEALELQSSFYADRDRHKEADSRNRLAAVFEYTGDFVRAETSYQRQLDALTELNGPSDATLLNPLLDLAFVADKAGDTARENPISYLLRALEISESALGAEHARTAGVLELLALALVRRERDDEARPYRERALAIRRGNVRRLALELSPDFSVDSPGERIGNGISAPRLLEKVEPVYSEEARRAKHQGTVVVAVLIDPQGRPGAYELIRSLGLGLDEKAAEAISRWKFQPGMRNDEPVAVKATIEVNFRLL